MIEGLKTPVFTSKHFEGSTFSFLLSVDLNGEATIYREEHEIGEDIFVAGHACGCLSRALMWAAPIMVDLEGWAHGSQEIKDLWALSDRLRSDPYGACTHPA